MDRQTTILTPPDSGERKVRLTEQVRRVSQSMPANLPDDPSKILLALDVDGTLLTQRGIAAPVLAAYRDLIDAGAHVVIATGRGFGATRPVFQYLQTDEGWAVCSNGAVLAQWDPGVDTGAKVLHEHYFDPSAAIEILQDVNPDMLFAVTWGDISLTSGQFPNGEFIEPSRVIDMKRLVNTRTSKLVGRDLRTHRDDFEFALSQTPLGGEHEYAVGWTSWVDVGVKGVTKASGLDALAQQLGVPPEGTVAVGDGTNDIPMFKWANWSVAMGGASQNVRAHADTVTGAVENNGAAAVMRSILER